MKTGDGRPRTDPDDRRRKPADRSSAVSRLSVGGPRSSVVLQRFRSARGLRRPTSLVRFFSGGHAPAGFPAFSRRNSSNTLIELTSIDRINLIVEIQLFEVRHLLARSKAHHSAFESLVGLHKHEGSWPDTKAADAVTPVQAGKLECAVFNRTFDSHVLSLKVLVAPDFDVASARLSRPDSFRRVARSASRSREVTFIYSRLVVFTIREANNSSTG